MRRRGAALRRTSDLGHDRGRAHGERRCGAERIVLHGLSRPMIDRVLESVVSGETTDDDLRFARAPGDGSDSAQTVQSLVVAPSAAVGRPRRAA